MTVDLAIPSVSFGFDIAPLTSSVFEITVPPGADPYKSQFNIDSSEVAHDNVEARFYPEDDAGTDAYVGREPHDAMTFEVESDQQSFYILLSNTDANSEAIDVRLEYQILEDVIFQAPDAHDGAGFGESIAVAGDKILIGAPIHTTSAGGHAGERMVRMGRCDSRRQLYRWSAVSRLRR